MGTLSRLAAHTPRTPLHLLSVKSLVLMFINLSNARSALSNHLRMSTKLVKVVLLLVLV